MENKKEIKVFITLNKTKIQSVNNMYKAGIKYSGGRPTPYIYKSPEVKRMVEIITESLRGVDWSEHMEWLKTTKQFSVTQNYIFKTGISRRDVGNAEKAISDAIVRFFVDELGIEGFDDSKFTDLHLYKSIIPKADSEYICIEIKPSTFDVRFDRIEKPEKLFLGGTCGKLDWRKELIPELKKRKLKFFNPVVPDWTPECQKIEEEEKETSNTHLYIITPEMKGVFSIAECVSSAYQHLEHGFCFVGIVGTKEDWGEGQWRSINAVVNLINNIGQNRSNIVATILEKPLDILNIIDKVC